MSDYAWKKKGDASHMVHRLTSCGHRVGMWIVYDRDAHWWSMEGKRTSARDLLEVVDYYRRVIEPALNASPIAKELGS